MRLLSEATEKELQGTALVRIDANATDPWRLEAVVETLNMVGRHAERTIVLAHKGRPAPGAPKKPFSLYGTAKQLADLVDNDEVWFISDTTIGGVRSSLKNVPRGALVVLENIRSFRGEQSSSAVLAKSLASLADYYVSDAFPVLHHGSSSVSELPMLLPSFAGLQLEKELVELNKLERVRHPYVVVIGGAKAEDKLGVIERCIKKADYILVGGASANAMLHLSGVDVGSSVYEDDPMLLRKLKTYTNHPKVILPVDFRKQGTKILDIGPKTERLFASKIKDARTILWTGPLGMIEKKKFSGGSLKIARAIGRNRKAFSVTGGGETVSFLKKHNLDTRFSFISTGGGALITYVAGSALPGLTALERAPKRKKVGVKKKKTTSQRVRRLRTPKLKKKYDIFFHDDFDGRASAAIFLDFFRQKGIEIERFIPVEHTQEMRALWKKKDGLTRIAGVKKINPAIVVDYQYHPQTTFWYDHHGVNFLLPSWKKGFVPSTARQLDPSYDSGAHLVYDALVAHYDYTPSRHIKELVRWANIIDAAKYATPFQTIALREPALQIEAYINRVGRLTRLETGERDPMLWLIELLAAKPMATIARRKVIQETITTMRREIKKSLSYYRKHIQKKGLVAAIDIAEMETPFVRFAPFYLVPQALYSIHIKSLTEGGFVVLVGANPWERHRNSFNIGKMLKQFDGGGHKDVGACRTTTKAEAQKIVDYFTDFFNGTS